ncbi:MAG: diacylglycerol kinase family protein [Planctomycetota bacterium]
MTRRLLILANPIAGGGRARALAPALASALRARGADAEVFLTQRAGDAGTRARDAGAEAWDALVAIGGDGTVNEVLNGMPDPSRPLGVLPLGTANVLARTYRLPRTADAAAAMLLDGHTRTHAIGRANGRRFLLFCGSGLDAAVVRRVQQVRTGTLGKHKWVLPILHVVRRWPRYALRVTLPDGEVLDDLGSVLVARVRDFGGVVQLTPEVDPASGLLHVLCFRARARTAWALLGARAALGRMRPGPGLAVRAVPALRIDGRAPCQIDGDWLPGAVGPDRDLDRIDLDLDPRPARLLAPPPAAGDPLHAATPG